MCVVFPFILDARLVDVPAGATQKEDYTGFLIHLPSAVLALNFSRERFSHSFPSSTVKSNLVYQRTNRSPLLIELFFVRKNTSSAPTNVETVHQASLFHIESNLDRLGMFSPTHGQRSQQQSEQITLRSRLINKSRFLKATRHTEIEKIEISRSMVMGPLSW